MATQYSIAKFLHILIAILALGTSAGMGIVLELYGDHPKQGSFILRVIERIELFFVVPGYLLMLATGLWLVHLSWPFSTVWIQAAMGLWAVGLVLFVLSLFFLHKQIQLFETEGPASSRYRRISLMGRGLGAGGGLVVVLVLYLMVFKPQ
jgi:uncharacterized membrane protein